ncbi:MAG TPA: undecaprenyl-diphosphate phosphatase [Candidatus Paceibacterota bacterium]
MELIDALILGLIQGITAFLPVSTSGHLVLVQQWLAVEGTNAVAFAALLHMATATAVIVYFWSDLWVLMQAALRKLSRLPVNEKDLRLFNALALGTVPAIIFALLFEPMFAVFFQNIALVAAMILVAAVFFMYVEWRYYLRPDHGGVTLRRGLLIGVFQALSLIPGFSRSGATIAGGMLLGMSRYEATRFSFLLAIPISLAIGSKKFIELLQSDGVINWTLIIVGAAVAAISSLFVIHLFLGYIKNRTLWPYIWYSVLLSAFVGYAAFVTL